MNRKSIKKNRDSNIRLNKKDKMNSEFNSKEGKTLIYNNSEKIIKRKLNDNKNIKNNKKYLHLSPIAKGGSGILYKSNTFV